MKKVVATWFAVSIVLLQGCSSPRYAVIDPLDEPLYGYPVLVIGEFQDGLPPDVPLEDRPTSEVADKLRGFLQGEVAKKEFFAMVSTDQSVADEAPGALLLTGKFISYDQGSRAARYIVGFGAGTGEIVIQLTLVDTRRGKELFTGNFKGKVSGGLFGGSSDEPLKQISRDFVNFLKREWS